jgi:hypothetical protein
MLVVPMTLSRFALFILIGFLLVLLGVVLPLLMVMHIVQSTLFLNFFSYTASVTGMTLGLVGALQYVRGYRKKG